MHLATNFKEGDFFVLNGRVLKAVRKSRGWIATVDARGVAYNLRRGTVVELATKKQMNSFPKIENPYVKGMCPKCKSTNMTRGMKFTGRSGRTRTIHENVCVCSDCGTKYDYHSGSLDVYFETPKSLSTKEKFKAARQRYQAAGVKDGLSCGDALSEKLYFMSLDEIYDAAAKILKVPVGQLYDRYSKLNVGMQRMNLGNRLRANINTYEFFGIPLPK